MRRSAINSPLCLCFFIMILSFFLANCGREDESQLTASDPAKESEVQGTMVVMGGNTSCGPSRDGEANSPHMSGLYQAFTENISSEHNELTWRIVATCYTDAETIYYQISDEHVGVRAEQMDVFIQNLSQIVANDSLVFLMGHSYGGWLAMKTALAFSQSNTTKLTGLFTIDPISRVHCSYDNPWGCMESPQDFDASQKNAIEQKTTQWTNLYQTETWYLHSSEIEEADDNVHVNTGHTEIDNHATTWERISENINSMTEKLSLLSSR